LGRIQRLSSKPGPKMTKEKFYLELDDEKEFVGDYESDLEEGGDDDDDDDENEEVGFLDEDEEDA